MRRSSRSTASAVTGGVGSFSQMGFLDAELAVKALQNVKGAYTVKSVNDAFKAIKDYKTEMLCQPFTYGNYSEHIPNNTDYTVTPSSSGGTMVVAQGCNADLVGRPADRGLPQDRGLVGNKPSSGTHWSVVVAPPGCGRHGRACL